MKATDPLTEKIVIRAKLLKALKEENLNPCTEFINKVESFNRKVIDFIESDSYCKTEIGKSKQFRFSKRENPLNIHYMNTKNFLKKKIMINEVLSNVLTKQEISIVLGDIHFFIKDPIIRKNITLFKNEKLSQKINREEEEEKFKMNLKKKKIRNTSNILDKRILVMFQHIHMLRNHETLQHKEDSEMTIKSKRSTTKTTDNVVKQKIEAVNKYIESKIAIDKSESRKKIKNEQQRQGFVKNVMNKMRVALYNCNKFTLNTNRGCLSKRSIETDTGNSNSNVHEDSTIAQTQIPPLADQSRVNKKQLSHANNNQNHSKFLNLENDYLVDRKKTIEKSQLKYQARMKKTLDVQNELESTLEYIDKIKSNFLKQSTSISISISDTNRKDTEVSTSRMVTLPVILK